MKIPLFENAYLPRDSETRFVTPDLLFIEHFTLIKLDFVIFVKLFEHKLMLFSTKQGLPTIKAIFASPNDSVYSELYTVLPNFVSCPERLCEGGPLYTGYSPTQRPRSVLSMTTPTNKFRYSLREIKKFCESVLLVHWGPCRMFRPNKKGFDKLVALAL